MTEQNPFEFFTENRARINQYLMNLGMKPDDLDIMTTMGWNFQNRTPEDRAKPVHLRTSTGFMTAYHRTQVRPMRPAEVAVFRKAIKGKEILNDD